MILIECDMCGARSNAVKGWFMPEGWYSCRLGHFCSDKCHEQIHDITNKVNKIALVDMKPKLRLVTEKE